MKTVEEKIAAWIDGKLTSNQLADLDRELGGSHWRSTAALPARSIPETDADQQIGALLRTHCSAPSLQNADFFNHQLMQRIEAEQAALARSDRKPGRFLFFSLPRIAWAGAFCLVLALAIYFISVPGSRRSNPTAQQFMAEIMNARTDDPSITASTFNSKSDKVTVLWLDGLKYLPDGEQL